MPLAVPTERDALVAVRQLLDAEVAVVTRFPTGAQHHVYDAGSWTSTSSSSAMATRSM